MVWQDPHALSLPLWSVSHYLSVGLYISVCLEQYVSVYLTVCHKCFSVIPPPLYPLTMTFSSHHIPVDLLAGRSTVQCFQ